MAIIGTIGRDIAPAAAFPTTNTYIAKRDPATISGSIEKVTIEVGSHNDPHTVNLKIFRIVGPNYTIVYNQNVSGMNNGENEITLDTPFNILVGDLLGYWSGTAGSVATLSWEAGAGAGYSFKVGNVVGTTAIVDWTTDTQTAGLRGNILSLPVPTGGFFMF